MQLIVDGESDYTLSMTPSTLADVLLDITSTMNPQGRVLFSILLNGESISPESLTPQLGERWVADIQSLEIMTASVSDLVVETLSEISEVIHELPSVCEELSITFSGESPSDGFGYFNQLLDLWEALKGRQAQVMNHFSCDPSALYLDTVTITEHNEQLVQHLGQARSLMEASQFTELAVLMGETVLPLAQREALLIEALQKLVST